MLRFSFFGHLARWPICCSYFSFLFVCKFFLLGLDYLFADCEESNKEAFRKVTGWIIFNNFRVLRGERNIASFRAQ